MKISVYCCIGTDFDLDILPHFIKYYQSFGVNNFLFVLHTNSEKDDNIYKAKDILNKFSIKEKIVWRGIFDIDQKERIRNGVFCDEVNDDDWVIVVDSDEFVEYVPNLEMLIRFCNKAKIHCVVGELIDRLSVDRKIVNIDDNTNLEDKFPIKENFLKDGIFNLRWPHLKVVLNKGFVKTNRGNHCPLNVYQENVYRQILKINHYKWRGNVILKLEDRVNNYKKLGHKWWIQSESFIRYFTENK